MSYLQYIVLVAEIQGSLKTALVYSGEWGDALADCNDDEIETASTFFPPGTTDIKVAGRVDIESSSDDDNAARVLDDVYISQ